MIINGLEWTFDTVASVYEKFRPGYPEELYKTIFDHIALNESCHAVEVGIGGGQATLPFLKTGCKLTAVEYSILLGTYSDHIAIEQSIREKFFSKLKDAINRHGGSITLYDTIDLQLARKS